MTSNRQSASVNFSEKYGLRRFDLAVLARLGSFGANLASKVPVPSVYYRLRHYDGGKEPEKRLAYPKSFAFPATDKKA